MYIQRFDEFSLFALPPDYMQNRFIFLSKSIATLSNSTSMLPHIPILTGITGDMDNVIYFTTQIAQSFKPFNVTIGRKITEAYFSPIAYSITNPQSLIDIHKKASEIFGANQENYTPSLNMSYPTNTKPAQKKLVYTFLDTKKLIGINMPIMKIFLFKTQGSPSTWREITSFGLSAS